jgi:serine protease AprX
LHPNPAKETVNFIYPVSDEQQVIIKLYDTFGQKLMEKQLNQNSIDLEMSAYKQGIYFIHVFENGIEKESHKLVIIK